MLLRFLAFAVAFLMLRLAAVLCFLVAMRLSLLGSQKG
jgi:low temperature requirement protein LtrA